jgi:catechol 2,3-dioxygenase-like lactoylglutathione lyase family enzyme
MSVQLNHTIVRVRDKRESAEFLAEILGLDPPTPYGPFLVVQVDNDVSLDFADDHGPANPQHYAFLVGESEFDACFGRIRERGLPYWTRASACRVRSTPTTAAGACTGRNRAATSWRSSPGPTAAAAEPAGGHVSVVAPPSAAG